MRLSWGVINTGGRKDADDDDVVVLVLVIVVVLLFAVLDDDVDDEETRRPPFTRSIPPCTNSLTSSHPFTTGSPPPHAFVESGS